MRDPCELGQFPSTNGLRHAFPITNDIVGQARQCLLIDRLDLEKLLGATFKRFPVILEDGDRTLQRCVGHVADGDVDLACGILGKTALARRTHEGVLEKWATVGIVGDRAEFRIHAVAGDDGARYVRCPDEVVGGPGREVLEDDGFQPHVRRGSCKSCRAVPPWS